jgi:hypothetical protein
MQENDVKIIFSQMPHDIRKSTAFFEGYQASPTCPSDTSSVQTKMSTESSEIILIGRNRISRKEVSLCHFVHQKSYGMAWHRKERTESDQT